MPIDVELFRKMVADSTPGKFEGELPETAYFYERMMEGDGEDAYDDEGLLFDVNDEERAAFGLNAETTQFSLYVSENGFVYGSELRGN